MEFFGTPVFSRAVNFREYSGNIRRGEGRKRKRAGKRLFLIVFITLLAMLVSGIRNMKAELEEMQTILKRIEVLQYENVETTA